MADNTQNFTVAGDIDQLAFVAEGASPDRPADNPWEIMLVDDEEEIHHITQVALANFTFEGRGLTFINAYSGQQAQELIRAHPNAALILLDVVMETDEAGLHVVKYIRDSLDNHLVRIVLRTGQPGHAPEQKVIVDYDINDYKAKTELTNQKLFTTVVAALRAFRHLNIIESQRQETAQLYAQLEEYNRTLEQKVIERTDQLLKAHREAEEARAREEKLQQQVHKLQIEVDKVRQARQVSQITGTNYFKQLREKAQDLRDMLEEAN
jgi:CheY-like chemotaxis protein